MIARQVFFTGHVQGVGFRYTTLQIAQRYSVTGWVRNLRDGRVEIQVKGSASDVSAFINHVETESRLADHIQQSETNKLEISTLDAFVTFEIRR